MVATACDAINRLSATAEEAIKERNLVVRLMAERTIAQEGRKWTELAAGRTVNVHGTIKSQRDLPKLDNLSPEKLAQLEALLGELADPGDVVDAEIISGATEPTTGQ